MVPTRFPDEHPSFIDGDANEERNESLMAGFEQVIVSLRQLDRLDRSVTWKEWMTVFRTALERMPIPLPGQTTMGVQVMDVMAARGRPFRTLFVLGMNDHVFPRIVREDAFLRDRDRKVLAESLGYKIDEKLNGFDEEALLFALLQHSAREHLYLLYQRADKNGRPLIPSFFLSEYLDDVGVHDASAELSIPVRLAERSTLPYFSPHGRTPQESRLREILEGRTLQSMESEDSPWWTIFQNGMEAIQHLERSRKGAGPFDGMINAKSEHWQDLATCYYLQQMSHYPRHYVRMSKKNISIVLLLVGLALIFWGVNENGMLGNELARGLGGGISNKVMMLWIGGGACAVLGALGLFKK